ncbi:hypothetical protein HZ326_22636 [Fusarium oxysporum f. sp. albedinis]|nr:hypothetical protein HZ326_22636 [Fusarium oxysporum f. sp. albedinis]
MPSRCRLLVDSGEQSLSSVVCTFWREHIIRKCRLCHNEARTWGLQLWLAKAAMGEAPETCDSGVWAKLRADIIRTPTRSGVEARLGVTESQRPKLRSEDRRPKRRVPEDAVHQQH